MSVGIRYLDGPRLARALHSATQWVSAAREEINRINVFPVPDGDTGTNLTLTLRAVTDALRASGDGSLAATAQAAARGAVLGARGNAGMMLAHFLLGLARSLETPNRATAAEVARGMSQGVTQLYASLDDPREGTILTVARSAAEAAERSAAESPDLAVLMTQALAAARDALAQTPEQLAILKDAGVVDAGGKGFVLMLEGVVRLLRGEEVTAGERPPVPDSTSPAALTEVRSDQDYQYCTEVLVRGGNLPGANQVRTEIRNLGGSVQVVVAGDVLKIHVHTDTPDAVFILAGRWGAVESTKAEDMRAQHRRLAHGPRRLVAVVADSSADLPDEVLDRHHIALVPLQVLFGDRVYRDRVELKPEEFYRLLQQSQVHPTTSQPTTGDFIRVLQDARAEADEVVAVLLGARLSGTYQAGVAAARAAGIDRVHFVDSGTASLGLGMLALRAAELAEAGWPGGDIAREIARVRRQSGLLLTLDRLDFMLRSGRVTRSKALLAGVLDLKPILSLNPDGEILPLDRVRGRQRLVPRVLQLLEQRLTPRPRQLRFGIAHAGAPKVAEQLRDLLVAAYRPRDCFVSLATGVLGAHAGPGAWAVFYQVEDGAPSGAGAAA